MAQYRVSSRDHVVASFFLGGDAFCALAGCRSIGFLTITAACLSPVECLVGLLDGGCDHPYRRSAPGVDRAASLCQAYEGYRAVTSTPAIGFEHAVLLVKVLTRGGELRLGNCHDCGALLVVDSLALRPQRCTLCTARSPVCEPPREAEHPGQVELHELPDLLTLRGP